MFSITSSNIPFNSPDFTDNIIITNNNIPDEINSGLEEISVPNEIFTIPSDEINIEFEDEHVYSSNQPKKLVIQESPDEKFITTTRRVKKSGRSLLPEGPNLTRTEQERAAGVFSDNWVMLHAGNRIIDFLLSAEVICELNLTSTPGEKRDLVIRILGALYQGDKGVAFKKKNDQHKNSQGGHDNAGAGLDINIRSSLMDRIVKKGEITPKTLKIMKYRGFCEKDFDLIKESYDKSNVDAIFKKVWRAHPTRSNYVFEGTRINEKVNRTTEISVDVNLFVDKKLEAYIRPIIIKLYEKIMDGGLTPRAATTEYVNAVTYFFTKLETNLKTAINLVEEYQKEFALIDDFNTISAEKCQIILNNLNTIIQKMCPAKPKKISTPGVKSQKKGKSRKRKTSKIADSHSTPPPSTSSTDSPKPSFNSKKIRMNKEFIRQNNLEGDKPELLPNLLKGVQHWGRKRGAALLEEMQSFYKQIQSYLKSVILEKEGTVDVSDEQYTTLFGAFNPESGKREVTEESIEAARARLWAPPTPQNKRPRDPKNKVSNPKPPKMRRLSSSP